MIKQRLPKEDLADFVRRLRNEEGLSQRDVEINSGGKISKGYLGQIETRSVLGEAITVRKLNALAVGLGVDENLIFDVARGKPIADQDTDDEQRLQKLLLFYFEHVPPECQLDMLASAQGIWQRRNKDAAIRGRHEARHAAYASLELDFARVEGNEPQQQLEVAATNRQSSPGSARSEAQPEEEDDGQHGQVRNVA